MKKKFVALMAVLFIVPFLTGCGNDSKGGGGAVTTDLVASGTVEHGSFLTLTHNLSRDDLTFTGQFLKGSYIYDYTEYSDYFGEGYVMIGDPVVFTTAKTYSVSTTTMTSGKTLFAYNDVNNSYYGNFLISGEGTAVPVVFNSSNTSYISATAMKNDNVLIAYRDGGNSGAGTLKIYDSAGNLKFGPSVFENGNANDISATTMTNGKVLIAYSDIGNSSYGTFYICNWTGGIITLLSSPVVFSTDTTSNISATPLTDGNVLIAYTNYNSGANTGGFVIYNSSGTLVYGPTVFSSSSTGGISATTLGNGNVLIAYSDGISSKGTFKIYSPSGTLVSGPTVFWGVSTSTIYANALSNGNVLIAYQDWGGDSYGTFEVYNSSGDAVTGPVVFESANTQNICATNMPNGNVLIAYTDAVNSYSGNYVVLTGKSLKLEEVNSNEVRLWNCTGETLDLKLFVNQ